MIEVSGLDRPGLLYDLTNTISRLNLNIASAHVATFGERAVDVFYVTDLTGAKVASAQRDRRHPAGAPRRFRNRGRGGKTRRARTPRARARA